MYGYVLQDWITIRGAASPLADIIQGESTWMGFSSFQDIVIWLDVREATFPTSSGTLNWIFETSPSKDNNLFVPMTGASTGAVSSIPSLSPMKVILANAGTTVPLATWVRWRVSPGGTSTQPWDTTFRVLCAANRVVRESRQAMWR